MKFTSIPQGFSSFRKPLVYKLDNEGVTSDIEVSIVNTETGETIGKKRLYASTGGEIDIAPYLRRAASSRMPEQITTCSVIDAGGRIKVRVDAGGVSSTTRTYVAAEVDLNALYTPLTAQYSHRTMTVDEFDTIGFFSMPDAVVEVLVEVFGSAYGYLTLTPPAGGQRCVAVTARDFLPAPKSMKVSVMVDGEAATVVEYEFIENLHDARRLAWFNSQGTPELYTFPMRKKLLIEAARKRIESLWGREAATVERDNELKLLSAYEPHAQIEAIAEIVGSPCVWLVRDGDLQPVDLMTDQLITLPCGEMGLVEVDVRPKRKGDKL